MRLPPDLRWILFDAVGTLIYPDPPVAEAYAAAARRYGSALSIDEIRSRFHDALQAHAAAGGPTDETLERCRWQKVVATTLSDVTRRHVADLFNDLWSHFAQPKHWRLFDDVPPALAGLAARGFKLAMASNFDRRLLSVVAGHSPLTACEHVFVSSTLGFSKPSPEFFRAIETRLAAHPAQLALVGDDELQDFEGATVAGWTAIRLIREARDVSGPTISSLLDLLNG